MARDADNPFDEDEEGGGSDGGTDVGNDAGDGTGEDIGDGTGGFETADGAEGFDPGPPEVIVFDDGTVITDRSEAGIDSGESPPRPFDPTADKEPGIESDHLFPVGVGGAVGGAEEAAMEAAAAVVEEIIDELKDDATEKHTGHQ